MNRKRLHSRSNVALKNHASTIDSQQNLSEDGNIHRMLEKEFKDKQLFQQSCEKINKIKALLTHHSGGELMQDINDVIDLIRGQRVKAKITIQDLHKLASLEHKNKNNFKQKGINTDQIIVFQFQEKNDQQTQTQPNEEQQKKQQQITYKNIRNLDKKFETYYKLVCMIDKINVDYRLILPIIHNLPQKYILPNVEERKGQYKVLKPQEIIKLQHVFMNKLKGMMPNPNIPNLTTQKKQQIQIESNMKAKPIDLVQQIQKTPQKSEKMQFKFKMNSPKTQLKTNRSSKTQKSDEMNHKKTIKKHQKILNYV